MICIQCNKLFDHESADCPKCGAPLQPVNESNVQGLLTAEMLQRFIRWEKAGKLNKTTAAQLTALVKAESNQNTPPAKTPAQPGLLPVIIYFLRDMAGALFLGLSRMLELAPLLALLEKMKTRLEDADQKGAKVKNPLETVLSEHHEKEWHQGLNTVAELDAPEQEEQSMAFWEGIKPLFNEYIWWFIGSLLIFAGSIMGMREAWLSLEGIPRYLLVLVALYIYLLLFMALSWFMSRKSRVTGRLLAIISLSLTPPLYFIVSNILTLNFTLGLICLGALTVLSLPVFFPLAQRFDLAGGRLVLGLSPSLVLLALLPALGENSITGLLLSFLGIGPVAYSAAHLKNKIRSSGAGGAPKVLLAVSLFGALAVIVTFFLSFRGQMDFVNGTLQSGVFLLWVPALCGILAAAFRELSLRSKVPFVYSVLDVLFLSIVFASAAGAAAIRLKSQGDTSPEIFFTFLAIPGLAAFIFSGVISRHRAAIHPLLVNMVLMLVVLSRWFSPLLNWQLCALGIMPALALLLHRFLPEAYGRSLRLWGLVGGVLAVLVTFAADWYWGDPTVIWWPSLACGTMLALAAHLGGGRRYAYLHYAGGLGIVTALLAGSAFFAFLEPAQRNQSFTIGFAALYGVAALVMKKTPDSPFRPLDDLSLLGIFVCIALVLLSPATGSGMFILDDFGNWTFPLSAYLFIGLTILVVFLRATQDRSRLVSFAGAALATFVLYRLSGAVSPAATALCFAGFGLFWSLVAAALPAGAGQTVTGRLFLGFIQLPFPARGSSLFRDAFAVTAVLAALLSGLNIFFWLQTLLEAERNYAILAGGLLIVFSLVMFFSHAFSTWELRGNIISLLVLLGFITLTALANRYGRPLAPRVVGLNLTIILTALWPVSRLLFHKGPGLARLLGKEEHGRFYHIIPLLGVGALGLLLFVDAFLIGASSWSNWIYVTPPTFFLGAGLAAYFVARSSGEHEGLNPSLALLCLPGFLALAQSSFLGTLLVQLEPPAGPWVPALPAPQNLLPLQHQGQLGLILTGLLFALLSFLCSREKIAAFFSRYIFTGFPAEFSPNATFALWTVFNGVLFAGMSYSVSHYQAALILPLSGLILFAAKRPLEAFTIFYFGGLLLFHSLALTFPTYPFWVGPAIAGLGLLFLLLQKSILERYNLKHKKNRAFAHVLVFLYALPACLYALATSAPTAPDNAVSGLLLGAQSGLAGEWMRNPASGLTLLICALSLITGAFQWKRALSRGAAFSGAVLLSFATFIAAPWALTAFDVRLPILPLAALAFALWAAVFLLVTILLAKRRKDMSSGFFYAQDVVILAAGALLFISLRWPGAGPGPEIFPERTLGLAAIILLILVSVISALRSLQGRHLYFAQTGVAALYFALKNFSTWNIPPEIDAIIALVFGFALLGVIVTAKKFGVQPLARSVRRFAGLLPVFAALLLRTDGNTSWISYEIALTALAAAGLYALLSRTGDGRLFKTLAAIVFNLALLLAALASDLNGLEIYLAPVGFLALILGQLFKESLPPGALKGIRISGGILIYIPAALKIIFEVGQAADSLYALIFGAICLLGILVGMLLQIRSYLFMGVLFFTLDVVANLLQTGLRNQRAGFILLSLTGLLIISALIFTTLKRELVTNWLNKFRKRISTWE